MVNIKDIYSGILSGLHSEPPDLTMGKKLIINVAPTGSFTNRQQNPNQPYTMEENVKAAIEACQAGAAVWHVHTREADGIPSREPAVVKETIERVFDKCPDIVTSVLTYTDFTKQGADHLKPCVEHLKEAGPRYIQTTPLNVQSIAKKGLYTRVITQKTFSDMIGYIESRNVRPEFQCDEYSGQRNVEEWLIKTGIAQQPPLMNMMAGFHGYTFSSPASADSSCYTYISTILDSMPKNVVKGLCAGGRNWLPFTVFAIMLGVDVVRVGMEDSVYVYPDRDDKLQTPAEAVEMVVGIAEILGREIATPAEARAIMALDAAPANVRMKSPATA